MAALAGEWTLIEMTGGVETGTCPSLVRIVHAVLLGGMEEVENIQYQPIWVSVH